MGFFDSAQDLLNRGMAATERGTRTLSLKTQLGDANKQRDRALAALGESLYNATKDNAEMRAGREELYRAVADADARREDIERQIAEVEEQSAAARVAATGARPCPRCGATVAAEHKFCAACGAEVPPIVAPAEPVATDATADPAAEAVKATPVEPAAATGAAATTDGTTTADVK
ncbi:MAG: zinc ribbon domain-containing protein [Eggerthellaceae bacterium]|nr:zinc ribbon domain-containing protein [Eggerthellaceae bacterium]